MGEICIGLLTDIIWITTQAVLVLDNSYFPEDKFLKLVATSRELEDTLQFGFVSPNDWKMTKN